MQQREKEMNEKMVQLIEEMERRSQLHGNQVPIDVQQSIMPWGAVLFAAIAAVFVLLFWLCWWLRKKSPEPDSVFSEKEISDSNTYQEEEEQEEEGITASDIQWLTQKELFRRWEVKEVVDCLLRFLRKRLANRFFPGLQPAVGVGSAFEGWSPCKDNDVYHLLVPLWPARGYSFSLELGETQTVARECRVRVDLRCACGVHKTLCVVHDDKQRQIWRRLKLETLLDILCTDSYLDVEKVARWFQGLVEEAWVLLPQAHWYKMKVLPFRQRSCRLQLTTGRGRTFNLEIMFGVQQGHTDIFFSSESTGNTPGTIWTESYAVVESKFFSYVARQVPGRSFHLQCLYLCSHILDVKDFSLCILKTVIMHLLNTTPVSVWSRWNGIMWLENILSFLHCCLEQKELNHFFFGNTNMPKEVVLTQDLQTSQPQNLLQHLLQDPAARAKAMRRLERLQHDFENGRYSCYTKMWSH